MNFPWTRHEQRYEYITEKGYVTNKVVAELGCGIPIGAYVLSTEAAKVFAVDLKSKGSKEYLWTRSGVQPEKVVLVKDNLYNFVLPVDVCVSVEVFEHMEDPRLFIQHISSICKYAFLTTPLAETTGKTKNKDHIAEYSAKDFDSIVSECFDIEDKKYQLGDMSIVDNAKPNGDSFNPGHVVQMVWCRRR